MLSVIILNVIMLNVIMLNVIMLNVVILNVIIVSAIMLDAMVPLVPLPPLFACKVNLKWRNVGIRNCQFNRSYFL
jgi:hypothetical protein